ncbi:hypothetical protein AVEN_12924-1 [Araneus ventricosus]|uniref:Uncharacterized protein n=1 Tax=Araneus ventricosus TaxID=182803 RepID=A0A4Y2IV88_ARAVE|nr:hypothetical protein AVEN_12924-1 [Araneus ventricosus]
MDAKASMQKTWTNGWPLTRISSKRFLSDEDIVIIDCVQDDDDGDDIVENTTSLISHTDGMKGLEATLCYVEQ